MCQKLRLEECFMIEMIEIRLNALGNSLKIMKNTRKQFRTLSMAFHDVQILSLPDMFLQWDRCGPRPWPEDCCRIGLSRIPFDSIGIMWRSLEKGENFRKSHLFNDVFYYGFQGFRGHGWSQAGRLARLLYDCIFGGSEVLLKYQWNNSWNSQGKLRTP